MSTEYQTVADESSVPKKRTVTSDHHVFLYSVCCRFIKVEMSGKDKWHKMQQTSIRVFRVQCIKPVVVTDVWRSEAMHGCQSTKE